MNILIVSSCPTHPTIAGNRKGILNMVEMFHNLGHNVFFLYIKNKSFHYTEKDGVESYLKDYWKDKLFIYKEGYFQKIVHLLISYYRQYMSNGYFDCDDDYPWGLHNMINIIDRKLKLDVCIVNYFYLTKALPKINIPIKALFTHDYFAYKSILVGINNVSCNINAHQEAKAMQRSPHIFSVNTGESEYFRRLSPNSIIYNVFSVFKYCQQPYVGNHTLLFLSGSNIYNIKGLKWFYSEIFPKLKKEIPDIVLKIGGSICKVLDNTYEDANVQIVGFVDSPYEFYESADVVINPTYLGTGLKIKTFESIAYDKITMAHPHSVDGIFQRDNAPIFKSIDPQEWLSFLSGIWKDKNEIIKWKSRNASYIKDLNNFIRNEYCRFLGSGV